MMTWVHMPCSPLRTALRQLGALQLMGKLIPKAKQQVGGRGSAVVCKGGGGLPRTCWVICPAARVAQPCGTPSWVCCS